MCRRIGRNRSSVCHICFCGAQLPMSSLQFRATYSSCKNHRAWKKMFLFSSNRQRCGIQPIMFIPECNGRARKSCSPLTSARQASAHRCKKNLLRNSQLQRYRSESRAILVWSQIGGRVWLMYTRITKRKLHIHIIFTHNLLLFLIPPHTIDTALHPLEARGHSWSLKY